MQLSGKQIKNLLLFPLFIGVLILLLNLLTPFLFRILPNDYMRTRLILETLRNPHPVPDVVIIGNSRGMSGINGYMLQDSLPGSPLVYSLTSTGQLLGESFLYYSSLPEGVNTVIQCVDIETLTQPPYVAEANRVSLYMYGYHMDQVTKQINPYVEKDFNRSVPALNFEARNCVFSSLFYGFRRLLDDDGEDVSLENELHFPISQPMERNQSIYDRDVNRYNQLPEFASYSISPEWQHVFHAASTYLKGRNVDYYLVIMPSNPDIIADIPEDKTRACELFKKEFDYISVIDCFALLQADDFYDAVHPNRTGATKLTAAIVKRLRQDQ